MTKGGGASVQAWRPALSGARPAADVARMRPSAVNVIAGAGGLVALALAIVCLLAASAEARSSRPGPGTASSAAAQKLRLAPGGAERYVRAYRRWALAVHANKGASAASVERFATTFERECTGALSGVSAVAETHSLDTQLEALVEELDEAVLDALFLPDAAATRDTLNRLARVRFEDRRDTRAFALAYRALAARAWFIPPVCEDMKAWAASGFTSLSPAGARLARERNAGITTAGSEVLLVVPGLISRQRRPVAEREAKRTTAAIERTLRGIESHMPGWQLLEAVGLTKKQPPQPGAQPSG